MGYFKLKHVPVGTSVSISDWLKKHGKSVRPELTQREREDLMDCFALIDEDGSGAIDTDELQKAFRILGMRISKRRIEELMAQVDSDGSGEVEFAEFVEIMTISREEEQEDAELDKKPSDGSDPNILPLHLMTLAYRRKKMVDGCMLNEDDTRIKLIRRGEEMAKRAQAEAAKIVNMMKRTMSRRPDRLGKSLTRARTSDPGALQNLMATLVMDATGKVVNKGNAFKKFEDQQQRSADLRATVRRRYEEDEKQLSVYAEKRKGLKRAIGSIEGLLLKQRIQEVERATGFCSKVLEADGRRRPDPADLITAQGGRFPTAEDQSFRRTSSSKPPVPWEPSFTSTSFVFRDMDSGAQGGARSPMGSEKAVSRQRFFNPAVHRLPPMGPASVESSPPGSPTAPALLKASAAHCRTSAQLTFKPGPGKPGTPSRLPPFMLREPTPSSRPGTEPTSQTEGSETSPSGLPSTAGPAVQDSDVSSEPTAAPSKASTARSVGFPEVLGGAPSRPRTADYSQPHDARPAMGRSSSALAGEAPPDGSRPGSRTGRDRIERRASWHAEQSQPAPSGPGASEPGLLLPKRGGSLEEGPARQPDPPVGRTARVVRGPSVLSRTAFKADFLDESEDDSSKSGATDDEEAEEGEDDSAEWDEDGDGDGDDQLDVLRSNSGSVLEGQPSRDRPDFLADSMSSNPDDLFRHAVLSKIPRRAGSLMVQLPGNSDGGDPFSEEFPQRILPRRASSALSQSSVSRFLARPSSPQPSRGAQPDASAQPLSPTMMRKSSSSLHLHVARARSVTVSGGLLSPSLERSLSRVGSLAFELLQGDNRLRRSTTRDSSRFPSEGGLSEPLGGALSTRESDLVPELKDDFLGLPVPARAAISRASFFTGATSRSSHDIGEAAVPAHLISHVSMAQLLHGGVPTAGGGGALPSPKGMQRGAALGGSGELGRGAMMRRGSEAFLPSIGPGGSLGASSMSELGRAFRDGLRPKSGGAGMGSLDFLDSLPGSPKSSASPWGSRRMSMAVLEAGASTLAVPLLDEDYAAELAKPRVVKYGEALHEPNMAILKFEAEKADFVQKFQRRARSDTGEREAPKPLSLSLSEITEALEPLEDQSSPMAEAQQEREVPPIQLDKLGAALAKQVEALPTGGRVSPLHRLFWEYQLTRPISRYKYLSASQIQNGKLVAFQLTPRSPRARELRLKNKPTAVAMRARRRALQEVLQTSVYSPSGAPLAPKPPLPKRRSP